MLVIAIFFASLAVLIAKVWLNKQTTSKTAITTPVVVASSEIPFGIKLEEVHLKVMDWSGDKVPEGVFNKTEDVIGKITKNNFYPGEMITKQRVAEHLGGSTLSSLITKEYRAISIRVNDVVGVAGFILPGNKIDILSIKGKKGNVTARTILENIKVLAVDQEASPNKEKPAVVRAVTLEITPREAEIIAEAMLEGKIQLTLRNPTDSVITQRKGEERKPVVVKRRRTRKAITVVPW